MSYKGLWAGAVQTVTGNSRVVAAQAQWVIPNCVPSVLSIHSQIDPATDRFHREYGLKVPFNNSGAMDIMLAIGYGDVSLGIGVTVITLQGEGVVQCISGGTYRAYIGSEISNATGNAANRFPWRVVFGEDILKFGALPGDLISVSLTLLPGDNIVGAVLNVTTGQAVDVYVSGLPTRRTTESRAAWVVNAVPPENALGQPSIPWFGRVMFDEAWWFYDNGVRASADAERVIATRTTTSSLAIKHLTTTGGGSVLTRGRGQGVVECCGLHPSFEMKLLGAPHFLQHASYWNTIKKYSDSTGKPPSVVAETQALSLPK
jgi:Peptidase A4 family